MKFFFVLIIIKWKSKLKGPIQTVIDEMYSEWLLEYSKAKIANATAAASNSQSLQCDDVIAPESKRMKQCKTY